MTIPSLDALEAEPGAATTLPTAAVADLARRAGRLAADLQGILLARVAMASPDAPAIPSKDDDEWISLEQAQRLLGVSAKWFTRRKGKLPFIKRLSRRKVVVSRTALQRWIAARTA